MGFAGDPFVPIGGVFEPVLRRASLIGREQANDGITASTSPIDARFGRKFNGLVDAEFVL